MYKLVIFIFAIISHVFYCGAFPRFCNDNSDCTIKGSICSSFGMCQCPEQQVFSKDGSKCLNISPGFGSACVDDAQCTSWILGPAVCNQKVCVCDSGYRHFDNVCLLAKNLKNSCTEDSECYDETDLFALKCDETTKVCVCNDGYYQRGDYDCRPSANATGKCFFNVDCESEDLFCDITGATGTCEKKISTETTKANPELVSKTGDKKVAEFGDSQNGISCREHNDCTTLENSFCSTISKTCICKSGFLFDASQNCVRKNYVKNFRNDDCSSDKDCESLKNSFCPKFLKKCTCKSGFIYDSKKSQCVAGLGSKCSEDLPCANKVTCNKDGKCQCPLFYTYTISNDKCLKPSKDIGQSCSRDENCYSLGKHASCVNYACECSGNSELDKELMYCKPQGETTGCKNDCKGKPHSTCQRDHCECDEKYYESGEKCLSFLGSECFNEDDCKIENANCDSKSFCMCEKNYIQFNDTTCLPVVTFPNETCLINEQCATLGEGWGCNSTGNCTCQEGYMSLNGMDGCFLIKRIGDSCRSYTECTTIPEHSNVVCRNSNCACDFNYRWSEDGNSCVKDNGAATISTHKFYYLTILLNMYYVILFNN